MRGALQQPRVLGVEAGEQLAPQLLGRQLDRRQRILDLVRQAARHLAPGGVALRVEQRRDVVEHDHQAAALALVRQRRAGPQQHARRRPRPAGSAARATRARPRPAGRAAPSTKPASSVRGPRRRAARFSPTVPAKSLPRIAPADWLALRSCSCRVDHQHAAGQAREDDGEALALALHGLAARARPPRWLRRRRLVMSLKECTRKPISSREGSGRRVPKSPLPTARVPAIRSLHRPRQALRRPDRPVDGRQHRDQQHQRQRQHEIDLQRLARWPTGRRTASRRAAPPRRAPTAPRGTS